MVPLLILRYQFCHHLRKSVKVVTVNDEDVLPTFQIMCQQLYLHWIVFLVMMVVVLACLDLDQNSHQMQLLLALKMQRNNDIKFLFVKQNLPRQNSLNSSAPRSKQRSFFIDIFSKSEGCVEKCLKKFCLGSPHEQHLFK